MLPAWPVVSIDTMEARESYEPGSTDDSQGPKASQGGRLGLGEAAREIYSQSDASSMQ